MKLISNNNSSLAKNWFLLSVTSLAISGLFAIFLVIGRSPYINEILPHVNFFKSSLTIHVNLSVTVWLLGMVASIYCLNLRKYIIFHKLSLLISCVGSLLIALSIFDIKAEAYLNNYIPFINSTIFEIGIFAFLSGILLSSIFALIEGIKNKNINSIALPSLIIFAAICYFITLYQLEYEGLGGLFYDADYFELAFWGAGHLIQFTYVQALIFGWFIITGKLTKKDYTKYYTICAIFNLVMVVIGTLIPCNFSIDTIEYKLYFTKHMIYLSSVSAVYAGFIVLKDFFNICKTKFDDDLLSILKNCIIWSVILFLSGGIIGLNISEVNTVIPAHYHGAIISVSLSLMGLAYILCQEFGFNPIKGNLAKLQPILYGSGQLMHIIFFAISGGYGALRKNPGTLESLEGKVFMGFMGLGGLISIIGGLFFVIIIVRAVKLK